MSKDSNSAYHQRLHALDLATGAELFGGPVDIQAKYPGTGDNSQNGFVVFDPHQYAERAGLLEVSGQHLSRLHLALRPATLHRLDHAVQRGDLSQTSVLDVTPNGNEGAIWQAGDGIAADSDGYLYFLDAQRHLRHHARFATDSRSTATTAMPS